LEDLRREVRGRKVILVWDGLPAHKSRVMKEYLLQQRTWLTVEALPGYSPKLNPVENLWGKVQPTKLRILWGASPHATNYLYSGG
jgi:putative transposase